MDDLTPIKSVNDGKRSAERPKRNAGPPEYSKYGKDNPWNQKVYASDILNGLAKVFTNPILFIKTFRIKLSILIERLALQAVRCLR